jgi:hypothetical protein
VLRLCCCLRLLSQSLLLLLLLLLWCDRHTLLLQRWVLHVMQVRRSRCQRLR